MLLSTSNSEQKTAGYWWSGFVVALIISVALVGWAEKYWRNKGYEPSIIDSPQLWALQRDKASAQQAVIFLGASRTQYGIDLQQVVAQWPGTTPIMLAINGRYPLASLKDLAFDATFTGLVLLDVDARGLAPVNRWHQQEYIDYYQRAWTPSWKVHRWLLNAWQGSMVVSRPEMGLIKTITRRLNGEPPPWKPYARLDARRAGKLDFSEVDTQAVADGFAAGLEADLRGNPPLASKEWAENLNDVLEWVAMIRARGGDVVFYEPPVSGRQAALAEQAYPRSEYWDRLSAMGLITLNYRDVKALQDIVLPDESHVAGEDRRRYTRELLHALEAMGLP